MNSAEETTNPSCVQRIEGKGSGCSLLGGWNSSCIWIILCWVFTSWNVCQL